ncbi:hypothetical protein E2C01_100376 [Portunus trituberculatus]|uniref:Uncharacterized protein n=1 Tax=Portunus trituberculatus TaxID=210409 RepID=A0A5B7KJB5_PORTR|nr:hypothetical protein [Portunus trituberculatus]
MMRDITGQLYVVVSLRAAYHCVTMRCFVRLDQFRESVRWSGVRDVKQELVLHRRH